MGGEGQDHHHHDGPNCDTGDHRAHHHTPHPAWLIERTSAMFSALGDPSRLRLMELLFDGRHCVSELAEETGEAMSTISQRLKVLHQAGLISRQREGRHIYYGLADQHIIELLSNAFEHAGEDSRRLGS
jgi:ArsR family transcriptional regulator